MIKFLKLIYLFLTFYSIESLAVVASSRPSLPGSVSAVHSASSGDDCDMHSKNGSLSQLSEINCIIDPESCLHNAAWFGDRDNSMEAVPTNKGVGAAQVTFAHIEGVTQGTQVAPGCFAIPAHGGNLEAIKEIKAGGGWGAIVHYPMNENNMMELNSSTRFSSPRLKSDRGDAKSDFIFVKVDNPLRPDNFIPLVSADNSDLVRASGDGTLKVHLYRPKTLFKTNDGLPDHNTDTWAMAEGFDSVERLYQEPQKVRQSCTLDTGFDGLVASDCPSEQAISGSPYVTTAGNKDYFLGMHSAGSPSNFDSFDGAFPNAFLPSSPMCQDYESICGRPCENLNEVLPRIDQTVSL